MKNNFLPGFDIDGVVLEFTKCFLETAQKKFGILKDTKESDITRYEYYECLDVSCDIVDDVLDYMAFVDNCSMEPVKGSVEVLTRLSKVSPLLFVTARPIKIMQQTRNSILSVLPGVDRDRINIVHCKGKDKHIVLSSLNVNFFVDDRTKNCRLLKENGINVYLFDRPWNKTEEQFNHVKSWNDIWYLLKEQYKNI